MLKLGSRLSCFGTGFKHNDMKIVSYRELVSTFAEKTRDGLKSARRCAPKITTFRELYTS